MKESEILSVVYTILGGGDLKSVENASGYEKLDGFILFEKNKDDLYFVAIDCQLPGVVSSSETILTGP